MQSAGKRREKSGPAGIFHHRSRSRETAGAAGNSLPVSDFSGPAGRYQRRPCPPRIYPPPRLRSRVCWYCPAAFGHAGPTKRCERSAPLDFRDRGRPLPAASVSAADHHRTSKPQGFQSAGKRRERSARAALGKRLVLPEIRACLRSFPTSRAVPGLTLHPCRIGNTPGPPDAAKGRLHWNFRDRGRLLPAASVSAADDHPDPEAAAVRTDRSRRGSRNRRGSHRGKESSRDRRTRYRAGEAAAAPVAYPPDGRIRSVPRSGRPAARARCPRSPGSRCGRSAPSPDRPRWDGRASAARRSTRRPRPRRRRWPRRGPSRRPLRRRRPRRSWCRPRPHRGPRRNARHGSPVATGYSPACRRPASARSVAVPGAKRPAPGRPSCASATRPVTVCPRCATTIPFTTTGCTRLAEKKSPCWLRSLESSWLTRIVTIGSRRNRDLGRQSVGGGGGFIGWRSAGAWVGACGLGLVLVRTRRLALAVLVGAGDRFCGILIGGRNRTRGRNRGRRRCGGRIADAPPAAGGLGLRKGNTGSRDQNQAQGMQCVS